MTIPVLSRSLPFLLLATLPSQAFTSNNATTRDSALTDSSFLRTRTNDKGILQEQQEFVVKGSDTLPHGTRNWFDAQGRLASQIHFDHGRKQGPARRFAENGRLLWEVFYRQDYLDSLERSWNDSGILLSETRWKWDRQEGLARTWDSLGRPLSASRYFHDTLDGDQFTFFADSSIATFKPMRMGLMQGTEIHRDSLGHLLYKAKWNKGRKEDVETWYDGSTKEIPLHIVHWNKGIREGEEREWWAPRVLHMSRRFRNDALHGWEIAYEANGQLLYKRLWVNGNLAQEILPPPKPSLPGIEEALLPRTAVSDSDTTAHGGGPLENIAKASQDTLRTEDNTQSTPANPGERVLQRGDTLRVFDKKGHLRSETVIVNGKWHGTHKLYRNGLLFVSLDFINDTLEGFARMYYLGGGPSEEIPYHKGKIQGTVKELRSDGSVSAFYPYVEDERHGTSKGWHPNGKERFEVSYLHGKKDGLQRSWHPNGKLRAELHWSQGKRHGESVYRDENGKVLSRSTFLYDVCMDGDCELEGDKGSPFDVE